MKNKIAKLILKDGTQFEGVNFGAEKSVFQKASALRKLMTPAEKILWKQ